MYLPQSYEIALLFMIGSMLCWGIVGQYHEALFLATRFSALLLGLQSSVCSSEYWPWGMTLGNVGSIGKLFRARMFLTRRAVPSSLHFASGRDLQCSQNLLLVAAIENRRQWPLRFRSASVSRAESSAPLSSYLISLRKAIHSCSSAASRWSSIAIICDSLALPERAEGCAKRQQRSWHHHQPSSRGLLMGIFYPLVSKSMALPNAPGPRMPPALYFRYRHRLICALLVNYLFMRRRPIDGGTPRSPMFRLTRAPPPRWHMAGRIGRRNLGLRGPTINFAASRVKFRGARDPPTSIGQGATMVLGLLGEYSVWRRGSPRPHPRVRTLLIAMFACFSSLGLAAQSPGRAALPKLTRITA